MTPHPNPHRTLMKHSLCLLLTLLLLGIPNGIAASDLHVWTDREAGVYPSAFTVNLKSNFENARIFWTRFGDASPAEGEMYQEPISIERSGSLFFFAFTPEPDVTATPIHKVLYFVESKTGYEHLRIREVLPTSGTVILKNYSEFPVDLQDWQLESTKQELALQSQQLAPGQEVAIKLEMEKLQPEIMLRAPDGVAKQLAALPILRVDEVWRCETRRSSSCRVFEK